MGRELQEVEFAVMDQQALGSFLDLLRSPKTVQRVISAGQVMANENSGTEASVTNKEAQIPEMPAPKPIQPPDLLFVGICRRAYFDQNLLGWTAEGLSQNYLTHLFPCQLTKLHLIFSFAENTILDTKEIAFVDSQGKHIGNLTISAEFSDNNISGDVARFHPDASRILLVSRIDQSEIVLPAPGVYGLVWKNGTQSILLGEITAVHVHAPPLTEERKAAIRSDSGAVKSVRLELGCKHCNAKQRSYLGLDRDATLESAGWRWAEEVRGDWTCECGKTSFPLRYINDGLRGMLGRKRASANATAEPLYPQGALVAVRSRFLRLLQTANREEDVQEFIAENPILLSFFRASQIIAKPQIGVKYRADFGIVTSSGEFLLIEIESPKLRLLKKDGHRTSGLTHAFEQVGDWMNEFIEHRIAILDGLSIDPKSVNKVVGVVIAGRDAGNDAADLRALRMRPNEYQFFTYDDLLFALDALVRDMDSV